MVVDSANRLPLMHFKSLVSVCLLLCILTIALHPPLISASSSSSKHQDSGTAHAYKLYGNSDAKVHLTLVYDLLCPYSAESWPAVNQLRDEYKPSELYITAHIHALPYHRNSYLLAKGATVVRDHNNSRSAMIDYMTGIFNAQDKFDANRAVTSTAVIRDLASVTAPYGVYESQDVGIAIQHFQHGFSEESVELETRAKWKHVVRVSSCA